LSLDRSRKNGLYRVQPLNAFRDSPEPEVGSWFTWRVKP
jgi:hypothetical protein